MTSTETVTSVASVSPALRARLMLRTRLSEHPWLYLPIARRRYPGPSPEVVSDETELVIDGYTRSASTYAVYMLQLAQQQPVRLAHHLHAPAQLIVAARREIPALALIREPVGAVLSQVVREPWVDMRGAATAYARFYEKLMPYRDRFVVAEFDQVTDDFPGVVQRLNERFDLSLVVPQMTEEFLALGHELMKERPGLSDSLLGFESGTVSLQELQAVRRQRGSNELVVTDDYWVPSANRDIRKAALRAQWSGTAMRRLRERAETSYRAFVNGGASG